jgi:hypothetical protein
VILFEVDRQEHERVLVGVEVVFDVPGEDEDLAGGERVGLTLGADGEVAFEDVDSDGAVGEVLGEARTLAEVEEGDGGLAEADQGFLAMALGCGGSFGDELGPGGAQINGLDGVGEALFGMGTEAFGVTGSGGRFRHGQGSEVYCDSFR